MRAAENTSQSEMFCAKSCAETLALTLRRLISCSRSESASDTSTVPLCEQALSKPMGPQGGFRVWGLGFRVSGLGFCGQATGRGGWVGGGGGGVVGNPKP